MLQRGTSDQYDGISYKLHIYGIWKYTFSTNYQYSYWDEMCASPCKPFLFIWIKEDEIYNFQFRYIEIKFGWQVSNWHKNFGWFHTLNIIGFSCEFNQKLILSQNFDKSLPRRHRKSNPYVSLSVSFVTGETKTHVMYFSNGVYVVGGYSLQTLSEWQKCF